MRAVNLLPPERRGVRRRSALGSALREPLLIAAVALATLVVAALGYSTHAASSKVASKSQTLQELDAQLAKLRAAAPKPVQAAGGTSRLSTLTTLVAGRTAWDGFLGTVSKVVPEDVWLLSLSAQATGGTTTPPVSTPGAIPSAVTFTGYTYSQPSVARMMRRLELVPWLQDVSLVTSTKSEISNHLVYQFTVGANFVPIPEVGT